MLCLLRQKYYIQRELLFMISLYEITSVYQCHNPHNSLLMNVCTYNYSLRYLWADRPDSPSQPMITDVSGTSITLRWDPPQDDGGCRVSNYIIEYFRVSCRGLRCFTYNFNFVNKMCTSPQDVWLHFLVFLSFSFYLLASIYYYNFKYFWDLIGVLIIDGVLLAMLLSLYYISFWSATLCFLCLSGLDWKKSFITYL